MSRYALVFLAALVGCAPKPLEAECVANADCGEMAICEEGGTCRSVGCLTTHDCVFGDYCNDDYACEPGCGSDLDCLAGETCEDHQCEAYGCRDTQLDCPLGEFCDGGTCRADDRGHCTKCDILSLNWGCSNDAVCVYYSGPSCQNNNDCDPGWSCDNLGSGKICHLDTCVIECNPNAALTCPRGLTCVDGALGDNRAFCVGDCPYLIGEGAF